MNCKAYTKCPGRNSPTFWTRKKLSTVTTQIRYGTGYADVDSWKLGACGATMVDVATSMVGGIVGKLARQEVRPALEVEKGRRPWQAHRRPTASHPIRKS